MFAVLHLADFPLQAVLRLTPAPRAQPAALLADDARQAAVIACTPAARAAGVELGQTAPQALARCSRLTLLSPLPAAEQEAQAGLLTVARSVSPLLEATAPGVATLEVTGLARARRTPALQAALAQLHHLGLEATAGLGPTPLLALYAARQAAPLLTVPDGPAFLAPLPLAVAEPPPELAAILAGWGVHTLGALTALPKAAVAQRLGPAGLALWERAAGETIRPLHLLAPSPRFTATWESEFSLETLAPLLFLLQRFLERLVLDLEQAGLAATAIDLRLGLSDGTSHACELRLPEPTAAPAILLRALHTRLESVRTAAPIIRVALALTPGRFPRRQAGLFDCALRDSQAFADTLARLAAIVGAERLGTPVPLDTHRPDAFTLVPPPPTLPPPAPAGAPPLRGLPLRRYRPPQPATVAWEDRRPVYVLAGNLQSAVQAAAGPWHGSGDWWQTERAWEREEWDVELARGGLYRLLHTPAGCFLEGEYD